MIIQDYNILLKEVLKDCNIDESFFKNINSYLELLLKKNEELNLISRKLDIKTIIIDHIYDCLCANDFFTPYSSITDIGSGGGFPAILLAIIFPQKKIQLIEKSPRKVEFLIEVIKTLDLKNANVICGVVSEQKIIGDCITCRAFKSILEILDMTKTFFNKGGTYLLYKGRKETIDEETKEASKKYKFNLKLDKIAEKTEKERYFVVVKK
ncbi:MAG: 16S rRNA (guanine(527)-N(7))-methyltransferase RsmG [Spirochaetes bacterium GWD1_27_9]|nr:MAG: 16S rRNA (guanine(527)-N(7))-methyltransferase RsmG [Spirochaetes bacterium GWB1_27_13]OHD21161.1 MAG: 16S rRNA (guanine(527)-N(7))-methyltransferase RsmG [Spirochaetes bacterium GWC1_27_15]OHD45569.1 MAG: 16S rRNA (guanine(527)-N(7))-methyltransferase RsmG [Spirochaetes bacterium GWD1_27_9]